MKTATLATVTALAALIVAVPDVSTIEAQAGVKIRANNKVTPRIRVKPKIRVRVNTKRMLQKKKSDTQTARQPTAPGKVLRATRDLPVADPNLFIEEPAFEDAIADLGRELGDIDLGDIELPEITGVDVAAVQIAFPVRGLGDDDHDADAIRPEGGLQVPGADWGNWDPNGVLPEQNDKPDSSHLRVNANNATSGLDKLKPRGWYRAPLALHGPRAERAERSEDTGPVHDPDNLVIFRTITWYYSDGSSVSYQSRSDIEEGANYTWWEEYDSKGRLTERYGRTPPDEPLVSNYRPAPTVNDAPKKPTDEKPGKDPAKLHDPEYTGGGEVIPVNCGSVACNEARKGKGLDPTTTPGARVLPADPNDTTTGTVADAPRTDRFWREVATTNPGTEPTDKGERKPVKTSMDQVLPPDPNDPSTPVPGAN